MGFTVIWWSWCTKKTQTRLGKPGTINAQHATLYMPSKCDWWFDRHEKYVSKTPVCRLSVAKQVSFWEFFFRIDGIRINFYRGHQSVTPYKMMFLGKSWSWRVWKMNCEVHVDTLKGRCFHSFRDLFGGFHSYSTIVSCANVKFGWLSITIQRSPHFIPIFHCHWNLRFLWLGMLHGIIGTII